MEKKGPQEKSDEDIACLVQSGKIGAFAVLVERYENKMKGYGRKFLNIKEDIEDIVQRIFIKAYKNIQSFDVKRKFSSWLYRIAHNEFVNELKRKKREKLRFFDFDTVLPHLLASGGNSNHNVDREGMKKMIDQCLDRLAPKYREPLILRYFHDLSYEEIADVLGIPVSTVGIRLKRGKDNLKSLIKKIKTIYEK